MGLDIMHAHLFLSARGWHGWMDEKGGKRSQVASRRRPIADAYTLECGLGRRWRPSVVRDAGCGVRGGGWPIPLTLPLSLPPEPAGNQAGVGWGCNFHWAMYSLRRRRR